MSIIWAPAVFIIDTLLPHRLKCIKLLGTPSFLGILQLHVESEFLEIPGPVHTLYVVYYLHQ